MKNNFPSNPFHEPNKAYGLQKFSNSLAMKGTIIKSKRKYFEVFYGTIKVALVHSGTDYWKKKNIYLTRREKIKTELNRKFENRGKPKQTNRTTLVLSWW